ncbi:hypothetical protein ASD11_04520 [Aeromicrobium sp. Root495]|uniref:hypothetical protein n=1 Tax=Aeromicrobium sp. Root495 TaxID=1736550 RepID=UPI0006F3C16D|nr:hypothetical protein [Aeromicrobium sp. Root495]KQY58897.1 hypothetical protein ASD11_04520 [Aeromicrobium sp. Root495]
MKRIALLAVTLTALSACGGEPDVVEKQTSSESKSEKTKQPEKEQGTLIASGFGQNKDRDYVGLAAVVKNNSDHAGQTVTVSFNLKNAAGEVINTESQVDSFGWPGQELAVVTEAEAKEKVVSVEATLLVEDESTFSEVDGDTSGYAPVDAKVASDEYGGTVANIKLTNPTGEVLKSPAVKAICYDADENISGSGYTFPELIAPNGVFADDLDLLVSPGTKSCKIYLAPSSL